MARRSAEIIFARADFSCHEVIRRHAHEIAKTMTGLTIALYQPDIAGNTGTILRLAACLGVNADIIEPAGFDLSDRNLKRAGMDYLARVCLTRHVNWQVFRDRQLASSRRLILASTKAATRYTDFSYRADDILLFGRESAGVPDHVHAASDHRVIIPMVEGQRSINIAMSVAMICGEALRQTVPTPAKTAIESH